MAGQSSPWSRAAVAALALGCSGQASAESPPANMPLVDRWAAGGSAQVSEFASAPGRVTPAMDSIDGVWAAIPGIAAPTQRGEPATAYDPIRNRLVLFGGYPYSNDVWELSLSDLSAQWHLLTPTGTSPSPRSGAAAIYDAVRDRIVMFGGSSGSLTFFSDVWALSTDSIPTWTKLTPTGAAPAGRYDHVMVYDSVRDRALTFGGWGYYNLTFNDTWELSFAGSAPAWKRLTPTGTLPAVRWRHAGIYDSGNDGVVIFGGDSYTTFSTYKNDTWRLSFANGSQGAWTQLAPQGVSIPSPMAGHVAVYDASRRRMLVSSGVANRGNGYFTTADTWSLTLGGPTPTWSQLTVSGVLPLGRFSHGAALDDRRDRLVIACGFNLPASLNDVWALPLTASSSWMMLSAEQDEPVARWYPAATRDSVNNRMLVYGGQGLPYATLYAELWSLSLTGEPRWSLLAVPGGPGTRAAASAVYDALRQRMILFGGVTSWVWQPTNDVWALSLTGTPSSLRFEIRLTCGCSGTIRPPIL